MAAIPSFARAAALTSVLISTVYGALPEALLFQRQDVNDTVGTNLYNCHDNCGMYATSRTKAQTSIQ